MYGQREHSFIPHQEAKRKKESSLVALLVMRFYVFAALVISFKEQCLRTVI